MWFSSLKFVLFYSKQAVYASVHWLQYTLILFLSAQKQEGKQWQNQEKEKKNKPLVQEYIPDCISEYFDGISRKKTSKEYLDFTDTEKKLQNNEVVSLKRL